MSRTIVIIGGDAAGMSAASKAKRIDPNLEVVVLERGEWVSYAACGLPYYVKGDIASLEDLVAVPAGTFRTKRGIDLRTSHEAESIDPAAKTVSVRSADGTYSQPYDKLLIATGGRAVRPPLEGMDLEGVFTFQSMEAGGAVREYVERLKSNRDGNSNPQTTAVIGGGYIGVEMAEALSAQGLKVHLFEMASHILAPFGQETARMVEAHLQDQGVPVHLNTRVQSLVTGDSGRLEAIETHEESIAAGMALVGVGLTPNSDLATRAGLQIGTSGAIATDEYGQTSDPDIYAAGDCAEARHAVSGQTAHVPLGLTANRHGRNIGSTLAGKPVPTGPIVGTATLKAFDLEVARTGLVAPREAEKAGFDPVVKTVSAPSRAHYYPGGSTLQIQMTGDRRSGQLLGAAMAGREGVAHRINTVATALHARMTVEQLEMLDLAYAPPFSPVWDPVLVAARVLGSALTR